MIPRRGLGARADTAAAPAREQTGQPCGDEQAADGGSRDSARVRCRHECGTALSALLRMGGRRQRLQQHAGVQNAECGKKSPTVRTAVSLRSVTSQSGPAAGSPVRDLSAAGVREQISADETGAASRK